MSKGGIGVEESRARMSKLQAMLADEGLDLFIVSAEESIQYLIGVSYRPLERPFFILVRPKGEPEMLVPMLERDHLAKAASVSRVHTYWDYPSPERQGWAERLCELIGNVADAGIEPSMPQEIAGMVAGAAPRAIPLIERLRLIKSPAEIAMLRHAARYADMGVTRAIKAAYYGCSLLELFSQGRAVQTQMIKEVGYDAVLSSVLAGAWPAPGSAMPHDVPSIEARLKEGPHIALSLMRVLGYCAECERTIFLAPPSSDVRRAFEAMTEARQRAFGLVWPGAACAEIDAAANGFLRAEGYGPNLTHRTGHGFGLSTHEGPWVAEGASELLAPGMLISIEPGIYLPGIGGVRHSDTVLVTDHGYETLTRYPTDLESLTVRGVKPVQRLVGAITRRAAGMK